ncbi:MAG: peptidoglycan-binding domain-containing protein [Patescibacteria group bacterium]
MKKLFPEFLFQGSKGPAVVVLQLLLLALNENSKIIPDGDFGNETAKGVKKLQSRLGVDQDGCFGPKTREAFFWRTGIQINAIPVLDGETTVPEVVAQTM